MSGKQEHFVNEIIARALDDPLIGGIRVSLEQTLGISNIVHVYEMTFSKQVCDICIQFYVSFSSVPLRCRHGLATW